MWEQYASLAAHYYVSGRFAARAGYVPLCGNLFHHAIELQLKCGLIKAGAVPRRSPRGILALWAALRRLAEGIGLARNAIEDVDRILAVTYRHSLKRAWRDFKRCHPADDLAAFDQLIKDLDPWEEIRYPRRGVAMSVERLAAQSTHRPPGGPAMRGVSLYVLNVERVDAFMQRMWVLMSISPEFFEMTIGATHVPLVASVYEDDNVHMVYM